MKYKLIFGDSHSIELRNKGRINALEDDLICPFCSFKNKGEVESIQEDEFRKIYFYKMFDRAILWRCFTCMDSFFTDLKGKVMGENI